MWSQPPILIGYDPNFNAVPSFCGGYAPSKSTVMETGRRSWQIVADDFTCLGPMPITRIRWWGSYKAWTQTDPPELQPDAWRIGFWTHEPDDSEEPPFVQVLVHEFEISADRIVRVPVGLNTLPSNGPETLFQYDVALEPYEWFHPFEISSKHNVFWISIVAVYPEDISRQNHWGWSTRPEPWREPAQSFVLYDDGPTPDVTLWPGILYPITSKAICAQEQDLDMAFELLTESPWVYRDQPFMTVEDWPLVRDEMSMLVVPHDPMIEREAADDWQCEQPGPITAVSWYGSYLGYANEACACDQAPDPRRPDFFILSIFENADPDQAMPYDHPGAKIWEFWTNEFEEVLIGSEWQPAEEPNEAVFRYTARLPEPEWFICDGSVRTLWFSVVAVYEEPLDAIPYQWGWTTRTHEFGAGAKWKDVSDHMSMSPIWWPAKDSADQDMDMCFTLYTVPASPGPIALWPLDEASGDIVHDIDNRHNGVLHNGSWTEGRINGALEFNGSNTYVDMGDSDLLAPDEMTLALWLEPEHMGGVRHVLNRAHTEDFTDYAVLCHLAGMIEFVFDERGSGPGSIVSNTRLALGEWAHVAVTRDPAQAAIFINGQREGAMPCGNRSTGEGFKLTISSRRGQTRFFHGRIDEVHLYDQVLSDEQIIQLASIPEQ